MHKSTLTFLATVVGLACAVLLFRLWRDDVAASAPRPVVAPTAPAREAVSSLPPARAPAAFSDPAVRALLAALDRMLARADVRPGETVLSFKDDAALARFRQRAGKAGLTMLGQIEWTRTVRVRFSDVQALRDELSQNAADYAEVAGNYVFSVPQPPAKEDRAAVDQVPFRNDALAFVGATGDRSQWGRGVTIALLDTGVASDATFGTGRLTALDIGCGTVPGRGEEDGHGTAVASLAGGLASDAPGVAPAANLLSIRVTDANGQSDIFTVAQAIVTAVNAGAQVINVSLGGYATNSALDGAISYATARGAVIVAAAGNDQAAQLAWPAADARVVSVGAVDRAEQQVSFSNSSPQLQLTAPGYGVQTAWLQGQRATVDGTSASAPIVSGAIAAVLSQRPGMTGEQAVQLLTATASDAGAPGVDPAFGNGILNVGWAMNRNNTDYVDTAVASHYYDAANHQMDFVVQNRSGRAITGLQLDVTAGNATTSYTVPTLPPGEKSVLKVPVDPATLNNAGRIPFSTTLVNPAGTVDRVPANNRRASVLTTPVSATGK